MQQNEYRIIDLDGTISDDRLRKYLIDRPDPSDRNFELYHSRLDVDQAMNRFIFEDAVDWANSAPYRKIILLTGRPEKWRRQTEIWLQQKFGGKVHRNALRADQVSLVMRHDADTTGSPKMKTRKIFDAHSALLSVNTNPFTGSFSNRADKWSPIEPDQIEMIYDDRKDVLAAFKSRGMPVDRLRHVAKDGLMVEPRWSEPPIPEQNLTKAFKGIGGTLDKLEIIDTEPYTAADILADAAKTFKERNAVYGDNYKMVARLVKVLFPNGVPPELVVTDQWHLFELKLVKISRFAISDLTHQDSIHDDAVYSAMIEAILKNGEVNE